MAYNYLSPISITVCCKLSHDSLFVKKREIALIAKGSKHEFINLFGLKIRENIVRHST